MKRMYLLISLMAAGCDQQPTVPWLGYGEGDYALIGAPQPGWVTGLGVERGQDVRRGQLLFTLDKTQQEASRNQAAAALELARASLVQEQANLTFARRELARQNGLARENAGIDATRDQAQNSAEQSAARIAQLQAQIGEMQAQLDGAEYALAQRRVIAQTEGQVQDIYYRTGEYVAASTPVISLLPSGNVFVRFFVPEVGLGQVHLGEPVRITCDGCKPMRATVTFISAQEEYTPPVIFSIGTREKLVYKLEARASGGLPVHPGEPVEVRPAK